MPCVFRYLRGGSNLQKVGISQPQICLRVEVLVNVSLILHQFDDYPFRTTIALRSDGWEIVESCKRLIHVADKRAHLGAQGALTILSKEWFDVEEWHNSYCVSAFKTYSCS